MYDVPNAMQIYQNKLLGRGNFERAMTVVNILPKKKAVPYIPR
jgi:hypothetical protein